MGQSGLVVTVPKAWWDYYGLKAGDDVIVIADRELRIRPMPGHHRQSQQTKDEHHVQGNQKPN